MNLLLLEDEEFVCIVCRRILERAGHTVTCVTNGRTGLKEGLNGGYDLCLLNVVLPDLDGYTIASRLQERRPDLPIAFLTGAKESNVRAEVYLPALFRHLEWVTFV